MEETGNLLLEPLAVFLVDACSWLAAADAIKEAAVSARSHHQRIGNKVDDGGDF
jgi:hypothetical protein